MFIISCVFIKGDRIGCVDLVGSISCRTYHCCRNIRRHRIICFCGWLIFVRAVTSLSHGFISSVPPSRSGEAGRMSGTSRLLGQTMGAVLVALLFKLFPDVRLYQLPVLIS